MRPEELDAQMDMLDVLGADDVLQRLPLIEGVQYRRPRTTAELLREDFGDGLDPVVLPR